MSKRRSHEDIDIVDGEVRSFEWFWAEDGSMPGLDDYERLDAEAQAAVIATLRHWADLPHGKRLSETRVNEEHDHPKIFAVKAGKHRFTVFHVRDEIWVLHRHYEKRKAKLDKAGKSVVKATIAALRDYEERVRGGRYYERG